MAPLIVIAAASIWAFVLGVKNWRSLGGKIIAIGAGLMLLAIVVFVAFVAVVVVSGWAGHPF